MSRVTDGQLRLIGQLSAADKSRAIEVINSQRREVSDMEARLMVGLADSGHAWAWIGGLLGRSAGTVRAQVELERRRATPKPVSRPRRLRDRWEEDAACLEVGDPELFFPTVGASPRLIQAAKSVCAGCPVRAECLAEAKRLGYVGIWGGEHLVTKKYAKRKARAAA